MMHHRAFNISGGPGATGHGLGGHGKPGSPNTAASHHHHSGGGSLAFRQTGVYDGKIAGLYDLEETLGRGHFAVVKLARHVFTGEKVAVKVIDKSKLDEVSKAHLFQEVRCMKLVQHPNVVRLYEVIDTATKLYLILELGDGGDLYDYIMRHDAGLSEQVARDYFKQIVRAITYCHQLHVVHRDLKPENVVFFQKLGIVKLTDFGFSNKFCPGQKLETSCGSLAYSAPEILLGDSYDAPAVDVWSLGVILYMLVCGQAPFQEANDSETLTMIMDCKYTIPEHISKECKDLIARMLVRTPEKRATLNEISTHSWLGSSKKETLGPEIFPLVSKEQLIEEDHNLIVQKIVNGNIASKEEIQECLDKNEYNHITATYYLLAERKLRAKRQEAATKGKRPENLSITQKNLSVARDNSHNQQPCLLTVPRTPGDVPQRARKCSIVQEDEEEEDMAGSGREELTGGHGSLNRRGSRSEGRLNLALQERLVDDRFKLAEDCKKSPNLLSATTTIIDRPKTSQVTPPKLIITTNQPSLTVHTTTKHRLGKSVSIPESQLDLEHLESIQKQQAQQAALTLNNNTNSTTKTKVLTDAATVSIPLGRKSNGQGTMGGENGGSDGIGRSWRTMPAPASPSRMVGVGGEGTTAAMTVGKLDILLTTDTISEEETSTSTPTHQPRPRTYISNNRTSSANNPHQHASASSRAAYEQRRAKFHTKHRTASCSSSDASDDDSEGRKKRSSVGAVKGVNGEGVQGNGSGAEIMLDGIAKPLQGRRDSHDDSSDSQEPGTGTRAANIRNTSSTNQNSRETNNKTSNTNGNSSGGGNTSSSGGRKNTNGSSAILGRRHKASRRRSGETTRLRESQSLNRITEVQEDTSTSTTTSTTSKPPSQQEQQSAAQLIISTQLSATQGAHLAPKVKGLGVRLLQAAGLNMAATVGLNISGACVDGCRRTNSVQQIRDEVVAGMTGSVSSPGEVGRDAEGKVGGHCSRRDGCAYKNGVFTDIREVSTFDPAPTCLTLNPKSTGTHSNNCNTFNTAASTPTSTSKKLRLGHLGKYLQLHKRFFIPLPAFLTSNKSSQKSQQTAAAATSGNDTSPRLYKAQSCGSLTHNRVQIQRDAEGRASTDVAAITLRPRAVSVVRCYCDINQNDDNASGGGGKLAAAMLVNEMCVHLGQASKCSSC